MLRFFLFITYTCDNFSDLRREVDDGIITIENSLTTCQLLS